MSRMIDKQGDSPRILVVWVGGRVGAVNPVNKGGTCALATVHRLHQDASSSMNSRNSPKGLYTSLLQPVTRQATNPYTCQRRKDRIRRQHRERAHTHHPQMLGSDGPLRNFRHDSPAMWDTKSPPRTSWQKENTYSADIMMAGGRDGSRRCRIRNINYKISSRHPHDIGTGLFAIYRQRLAGTYLNFSVVLKWI